MTGSVPHVEEFLCAIVGQRVALRWTTLNWREKDGQIFSARTRSSCDGSPACGRMLCGVTCPFRWRAGDTAEFVQAPRALRAARSRLPLRAASHSTSVAQAG